jgi:hypothetical protein
LIVNAFQWIESTALSTGIRESVWTYPVIESAHVLVLCVFFGLTVLMDLRLVGVVLPDTPVSVVMARLLPWIRAGFAVMVATGLLLFVATPVHFYSNVFFRVKLLLLLFAGINVWTFHRTLYPSIAAWGHARRPPARARLAGVLSLTFWIGIVTVGRLIAYNWFE